MIKLLSLDMDGTLFNSQKKISQENISAIHKAIKAGVKLVLCTGRPPFGVRPYYEHLGLAQEDEYVIVDNGCAIHRTSEWKVIDSVALDKQDIHYLYSLTQNSSIQLTLFDMDHYLVVAPEASELVTMDAGIVNSKPTPVSEEDLPNLVPIFQAMYVGDPSAIDAFQAQHEAALEADFNTVRSQDILFEILPKGASKASALQALSQTLGYRRDQVMALGDANNDLEMLRFAGYSVAMGNGNAAVKEIADFITLTNDEDGVAHAIHKLIETEKGE